MLDRKPRARRPTPMLGRAVFAKTCQQCHTLFGVGGNIGPELTGSNRADLDYLLSNVLDPSALIGKDYQAHVVATADGRVLTGIIRAEDKDAITLATANETLVIPKDEIEERGHSEQSMMPDDLLDPALRPRGPLAGRLPRQPRRRCRCWPRPRTPRASSTAATSPAGTGDPTLWSVEDGEIVGRTGPGLEHNEFLRSDLLAGDFRLTLEVKLVDERGEQRHPVPQRVPARRAR